MHLTPLVVVPDIERAPFQLDRETTKHGQLTHIGLLRHGTANGKASVGMVAQLDDGTPVVLETTWALLHGAVRALAAGPVGSEETQD